MSKQRHIRKRRSPDADGGSDADEEELRKKLEATRDLQKHRIRSQGLTADDLAGAMLQGTTATATGGKRDNEFMGGYIKEQAKATKAGGDPEREKYIKEQLDKRLGRLNPADQADEARPKEDNAYAIPAALRTQKANQEDVSAWMTGIVEVPLSVSHKLKNIEETEAAKKQLLLSTGARPLEEEDEAEAVQQTSPASGGLVRISYPLHFGRQSEKEEDWRQRALSKTLQPRERKKKRPAP